ncbi:AMP-binding acetyl-CoA synthetase [Stagnimonas aquatica]|uniref:AMP-binding acetyl-CoA synthetase n=1 Tax=Stagnimonas aquatica TaxID=2689987 RepID=A0A3N0V9X5_9GAMM|nr:AMP-binding protein [Stagnimonas aquatica]ROH89509.1 AMP-binding acetyl-CoA synthetase [Stagnimonas aquatica]
MTSGLQERSPLACLYHWKKTQPQTVHFVQPTGGGQVSEYTWAQILDEVRRMAAHLQSLQLPPRSQIALLGKNSAHWIMADWAIWMAGHVSVPLYPTLNADTVRYILEHSGAKLLFLGKLDDWPAMQSGVPASMPIVRLPLSPEARGESWSELIADTAPLQGEPDRRPDELATIVYTSGSTGQPKGVMQSFRSFQLCGSLLNELFPLTAQDRMLSYLPLAHVAERLIVENASTYHGFKVYFAESLETFVNDLRRAKPTMFFSVPRLWTKFHLGVCAKLPLKKQRLLFRIPLLGRKVKRKILEQLGLEHVRIAVTGAAPLPAPIVAWYRSLGLDLLEAYGMSENFAYSHFTRPGDAKTGYVGPPNPGVDCRIGDNGEILVKSPAQMMGYYLAAEATAEAYTADGYFKTGDMGEVDSENRLRITGRVKELFKTSKGKYVAPVPIENKLGAHPKLEVVCVGGANQAATYALALLSEDTRKQLGAGGDRAVIETELVTLMEQVNTGLDPHEHLQFITVVREVWGIDNGFLTPTMKIKRNVIEKHYEPQVERWFRSGRPVIWEGA